MASGVVSGIDRETLTSCLNENNIVEFKKMLTKDNSNHVVIGSVCEWTPLHYAACSSYNKHNNPYFIKYLVCDCGANIEAQSSGGYTPLHIAATSSNDNNVNCLGTLLKLGSKVVAYNNDGTSAMMRKLMCGMENNSQSIRILLNYGAVLPPAEVLSAEVLCGYNAYPQWMHDIVNARCQAKYAAVIVIGIRKFCRAKIMQVNNIDIARVIARYIWENRLTGVQ